MKLSDESCSLTLVTLFVLLACCYGTDLTLLGGKDEGAFYQIICRNGSACNASSPECSVSTLPLFRCINATGGANISVIVKACVPFVEKRVPPHLDVVTFASKNCAGESGHRQLQAVGRCFLLAESEEYVENTCTPPPPQIGSSLSGDVGGRFHMIHV